MKSRLQPKAKGPSLRLYLLYIFGRTLQVAGLVAGAFAMTAFFGTPSTIAMLRMMLAGVILFVPGYLIVRSLPPEPPSSRPPSGRKGASR
jgi:hypothetical protein